jgi:hypothetical protein
MNPVASAIVVEPIDPAQKGEAACAVAFARTQRAVIDDVGPCAVPANDPAQLHAGKQVASGGIQPDRDLAVEAIECSGQPVGCVRVDGSVEVHERGIAEHTGF